MPLHLLRLSRIPASGAAAIAELHTRGYWPTRETNEEPHRRDRMDGTQKNRLKIDVEDLANRRVKKRRKRDLNETIYYEINDKKVAVFTPEFLEENRLIEGELRKLRKLNNDYDEHNSVLIKYIDSLNVACEQACEELRELTECRDSISAQLDLLKTEIKEKYALSIDNNGDCANAEQ